MGTITSSDGEVEGASLEGAGNCHRPSDGVEGASLEGAERYHRWAEVFRSACSHRDVTGYSVKDHGNALICLNLATAWWGRGNERDKVCFFCCGDVVQYMGTFTPKDGEVEGASLEGAGNCHRLAGGFRSACSHHDAKGYSVKDHGNALICLNLATAWWGRGNERDKVYFSR